MVSAATAASPGAADPAPASAPAPSGPAAPAAAVPHSAPASGDKNEGSEHPTAPAAGAAPAADSQSGNGDPVVSTAEVKTKVTTEEETKKVEGKEKNIFARAIDSVKKKWHDLTADAGSPYVPYMTAAASLTFFLVF